MLRSTIPYLLFASTVSFGLALVLPLMQTSAFYFFEDHPSILQLTATLFDSSEWLLMIIIMVFAILLPAVKLLVLHITAFNGSSARMLHAVAILGRWSMLDVLVVALIIVAVKSSGIASAASQPGLWFFAASALGSALASELLKRFAPAAILPE